MEGLVIAAIILGVLVLGGIAAFYAHKAEQKRIAALRTIADARGWQFDQGSDHRHDEMYGCFGIFKQGHSRRAYNTITGAHTINGNPHPIKMGDYLYKVTSHNGKTTTTTTYRLSYLIIHLPYLTVPNLQIRPENFFDKIGAAIGFDDIDFESAEFSRKFLVKSTNKRFAYDVITPRMMEFLMASPKRSIDQQRGIICITNGVRRWKPDEFMPQLAWISEFLDLWPDHVVRELEERMR